MNPLPRPGQLELQLPEGKGLNLEAVAQSVKDARLLQKICQRGVSGYGRDQDLQRSTQAGFAAHLVKPADPAQVHACLSGLLSSQAPAA